MDIPTTDWRGEVTDNNATLKIKDGDVAELLMLDEGKKKSSADYGNSIVFSVVLLSMNGKETSLEERVPKTFYVKANNYDLLGQIKLLGKLTETKTRISRIGSTKSNTRYKIVKL